MFANADLKLFRLVTGVAGSEATSASMLNQTHSIIAPNSVSLHNRLTQKSACTG